MLKFLNQLSPNVRLVVEGLILGLLLILIVYATKFIVRPFLKVDLPEVCKGWNKKWIMEVSLLLASVILWIVIKKTQIIQC
jgi:hypothetical protein